MAELRTLEGILTGLRNSGVDLSQIHVRRHDEGDALKEGVPGGILRRLILPFQRGLSFRQ